MAFSCVNISSREFKKALKDYNLSSGTLAGIVSRFQSIDSNAGKFPDDDYIKRQLYPIYTGNMDEVRFYNSKKDMVNKTFDDYESAINHKNELLNYFRPENIKIFQTGDGKWEVKTARPVPDDEEVKKEEDDLVKRINSSDSSKLTKENFKKTEDAFFLRFNKHIKITNTDGVVSIKEQKPSKSEIGNAPFVTTMSDNTDEHIRLIKVAVDTINNKIDSLNKKIDSEKDDEEKWKKDESEVAKLKSKLKGLRRGDLVVSTDKTGKRILIKENKNKSRYNITDEQKLSASRMILNLGNELIEKSKTPGLSNELRNGYLKNAEFYRQLSMDILAGKKSLFYNDDNSSFTVLTNKEKQENDRITKAVSNAINNRISEYQSELEKFNEQALKRTLSDDESSQVDVLVDNISNLEELQNDLYSGINSGTYNVTINKGVLKVSEKGNELFSSVKAAAELNNNTKEKNKNYLTKVISGGQTGMDQSGLKIAKEAGIATGGVMTRGWITEYGTAENLRKEYGLTEDEKTEDKDKFNKRYKSRTKQNAENADGTIYFVVDPKTSKGLVATKKSAKNGRKTSNMLIISPDDMTDEGEAVNKIVSYIKNNDIRILNVAGSRQSSFAENPELKEGYERLIRKAFDTLKTERTGKEITPYFTISKIEDKTGKYNSVVEMGYDKLYNDVSKEEKIKQLRSLINSGAIPISTLIVPVGLDSNTIKALDSMEKYGIYKTPNGNYTVGLKENELLELSQYNNLLNSGIFTNSELREIARDAIFKFSEGITVLQTDEGAGQSLLGDDYKNVDFKKMSRIDIINKVGFRRLMTDLVKERYFNSLKNPYADEDDEFCDKMNVIYDNFDAFIQLGYDTLINLEGISTTENYITHTDNENMDSENGLLGDKTDEEIQEIYGSTAETWQVGFRQISAFTSLSKIIKNMLGELYDLNPDTTMKINGFGIGKLIDPSEATAKILNYTQGAESLDDKDSDGNYLPTSMIAMLQKHIGEEPWLQQLVGSYYLAGNPDEQKLPGCLIDGTNNEQLKSQFYSNFQKYFQKYTIVYKTKDGGTRMKVLNKNTYVEGAMKELSLLIAGKKMGNLTIWDAKKGTINIQKINRLNDIYAKLLSNSLGKAKVFDSNSVDLIKEVYDILDIKTPDKSAIDWLFNPNNDNTKLGEFLHSLHFVIPKLERLANKQGVAFNPFSDGSLKSDYSKLLTLLSGAMGDSTESVTYQAGKMYYSYVNPGYLGTLVSKLSGHTSDYDKFIRDNYKKFEGWFFNSTTPGSTGRMQGGPQGWLNYWLEEMIRDSNVKKNLQHTVMLSYDGIGYKDMSPAQYEAAMYGMYNYDAHKGWAYYRVPVLSNKPSGEFIKFERFYTDYKSIITRELAGKTFWQEINRIRAVNYRNSHITNKELLIKNFDKNGSKFQFLDYLNDYVGKGEFGSILQKIINNESLDSEKEFTTDINGEQRNIKGEAAYFNDNLKKVIENEMNKKFDNYVKYLNDNNIVKSSVDPDTGRLIITSPDVFPTMGADDFEEFFWNDNFATINILQLTVGDLAYYKNSEDLQKRIAELHASGLRGNVNATINGKKVTDGISRTVYLKDDVVKSDIYNNLKETFRRILDNPKYSTPAAKTFMKSKLDRYLKAFEEVNVADAQGYSSPTSYRKKMAIFGNWSDKEEQMYKRILSGNFDASDIDTAMQVLKPFVYSQVSQNGYNPYIPTLKMGVQNKNSEFTLVIADALMRGQGINNKLSALYDIMEESQGLKKDKDDHWTGEPTGKGIDTIQFESTVKVGPTGVLDINNLDENAIKQVFREKVYNPDGSYNLDYLHEIPFEDYCIQQNIPMHLQGFQQMGSQQRVLAIGNMSDSDENGNINYVTVQDEDDKGNRVNKEVSVQDAKKEYFDNVAKNVENSRNEVNRRFRLDDANPKMRNIALSRMLRQEILKDSRYGIDMLWACSVNKNGDFNIPLSDPIQAGRIQQLLNSIIKNSIDKQQIAGGPVVQVSNFGGSEDLQIRFQNKEGKILLTQKEFDRMKDNDWEPDSYKEKYVSKGDYKSYDEYVKDNQDRVAYYETYMTPWDDNLYKDFPDGKGGIDIEAMERENPRLLEFISYRIPTEGKYSMVPGKIVGFLPKEAGEGVMYPKEITSLSGSDFDIDKDYVMHYNLNRIEYKDRKAFIEETSNITGTPKETINSILNGDNTGLNKYFIDKVLNSWDNYKASKITYRSWTDGRFKVDNDMIATQWAMITSKQASDQLFTPGNFDEPKRLGYLMACLDNMDIKDNASMLKAYRELSGKSIDELKDLSYKNSSLLYNDVQLKFHKQNMVAGKLIGVFAQSNTSHVIVNFAKNPMLYVSGENSFTLNGNFINGSVKIDSEYGNDNITRESEILAQLLASSVDAVKDPVLNLMNINMATVNVATTLARLGYDLETIALITSHPAIKELVNTNSLNNINGYESISTTLDKEIADMGNAFGNTISIPADFDYSKEFLLNSRIKGEDTAQNMVNTYYMLSLFKKIQDMSNAFRIITHATRYNSITSAVGPLASDTILSKMQDNEIDNNEYINDVLAKGSDLVETLKNNPILKGFRESSYQLENSLLGRNILEAGPVFKRCSMNLYNLYGYMSKNILTKYSNFFSSYYINIDNPIFDLSTTNRAYMINDFPLTILHERQKFPDNILLKNISLYSDNNNKMLSLSTRGLTSDQEQQIRSAWSDLYKNDPDYALKLVEYNFMLGSFGFSPKTFMSLVPNDIKLGLPGYIENAKNERYLTLEEQERMNIQFMLNNKMPNFRQTDENMRFSIPEENKPFLLDSKYVTGSPNANYGIVVLKDSKSKEVWCSIKKDFDNDNSMFVANKVNTLGGNNQGFEINPDEDVPETIYKETEKVKKSEGENEGDEKSSVPQIDNSLFLNSDNNYNKLVNFMFSRDEKFLYSSLPITEKLKMFKNRFDTYIKSDSSNAISMNLLGSQVSDSVVKKMQDILTSLNMSTVTIDQANEKLKELNLCE